MKTEFISKKGYKKLKRKLYKLKHIESPKVIKDIAVAREQGDLSENAEYSSAKERQRFLEREIANLKLKLANMEIIDKDDLDQNKVRFGAKLVLEDMDSKRTVKYKIVGEDETGGSNKYRKISYKTPIAKALLGKELNEKTKIKVPAGTIKYKIKKINY